MARDELAHPNLGSRELVALCGQQVHTSRPPAMCSKPWSARCLVGNNATRKLIVTCICRGQLNKTSLSKHGVRFGVSRTKHFHVETMKGEQEHPAMGALHPFYIL